jgi:hypothetical protein
MLRKYQEWIAEYVKRTPFPRGQCINASREMREAFPELIEVRGHVYCAWGKDGHVWLTTPQGEILDPTRGQFPGSVEYHPWKPGCEVEVGRCMNCGEYIWESVDSLDNVKRKDICSPECAKAFEASLNST